MKRILVVGTSGCGKSTFARTVAQRLGVSFVASDDFWWESGWRPAPKDVVESRVLEVANQDAWVLESNFDAFRETLWPRAELIVWLDFSRPIVFWRVIRRNLIWALGRTEVWSGNRMTFRRALLGVRHSIRSYAGKRQNYPGWLAECAPAYLRFRRPRDARDWLVGLGPGSAQGCGQSADGAR